MERLQELALPSPCYPRDHRLLAVMWWLLCTTPWGHGPPMTWFSAGRAISIYQAMGRNITPDMELRSLNQPLLQPYLWSYHQVRSIWNESPSIEISLRFNGVFYCLPTSSWATWRLLSTCQPDVSALLLLQPFVPRLISEPRLLSGRQCAALAHHHPSFWEEIRVYPQSHKGLHWRQRHLQRAPHCLGKKKKKIPFFVGRFHHGVWWQILNCTRNCSFSNMWDEMVLDITFDQFTSNNYLNKPRSRLKDVGTLTQTYCL